MCDRGSPAYHARTTRDAVDCGHWRGALDRADLASALAASLKLFHFGSLAPSVLRAMRLDNSRVCGRGLS